MNDNIVILGLGSNVGWRFENLRAALRLIEKLPELSVIQVSPLYQSKALLPKDAPLDWDQDYINAAVNCYTTHSPEALIKLIKNIESQLSIRSDERWSPRVIDIDILAWGTREFSSETLHIPHKELLKRPFALWPLLDVCPEWKHPKELMNEKKSNTLLSDENLLEAKQLKQRIDTPALVGILNITPDSFSDGGLYNNVDKALLRAKELFANGAEVIDIGAESTRPGATLLTPEQEWQRLSPILIAINDYWKDKCIKPKISIDTRHAETARRAISNGAHWINDVSGCVNKEMCSIVADTGCQYVLMHSLGAPADPNETIPKNTDPVHYLLKWMKESFFQLNEYGVKQEQIILDIGIGFGKTAAQTLALLRCVDRFQELGVPLLIGHSRKSFLKLFTKNEPAERRIESIAVSAYLSRKGVDYLRVHDVLMNSRILKVSTVLN